MNELASKESGGEFLLYQTKDGRSRIEVRLQGDTVWLTINQMANLFQVDKSGMSRHLRNIYKFGELELAATVANFATVQTEGSPSVSGELEPEATIKKFLRVR
ncbi:MAG: hypothetical protein JRI84_13640 [Deltaproteobacteria bacterium]|nr:hypothetical protein [Deltaproteobacteria bacterium]